MRLFDAARDGKALPGKWLTYAEGVEDGKPFKLELEVRALTVGEDQVTATRKGSVVDLNADKTDRAILERATLALIDSRGGAEVRVLDKASADLYTAAVGTTVKAGDMVLLDGKWGSQDLKRLALSDAPELAAWVSAESNKLRALEAQEEEGKEQG
jgi:hypothetical protein